MNSMRKLIATTALTFGAAFALALANADEEHTSQPQTEGVESQAGVADPGTGGSTGDAVIQGQGSQAQGPNLCTDTTGVIFRKGTSGYERCIESQGLKEENAGEAGQVPPPADPSTGDITIERGTAPLPPDDQLENDEAGKAPGVTSE